MSAEEEEEEVMSYFSTGRFEGYSEEQEDFQSWTERFDSWILANNVDVKKKVSVFLSVVGAAPYSILKDLLAPVKPHECLYADLTEKLITHYSPKPLVLVERFKFYKRVQQESESLNDFVVALKRLASTCEFGNFLKEALRDRFVLGMKNQNVQQKLISKRELTFETACDIAIGMETAKLDSLVLRNQKSTDGGEMAGEVYEINRGFQRGRFVPNRGGFQNRGGGFVNRGGGFQNRGGGFQNSGGGLQNRRLECFRCGENHPAQSCRFRSAACYRCGKIGHVLRRCNQSSAESFQNGIRNSSSRVDEVQLQTGESGTGFPSYEEDEQARCGNGDQIEDSEWLSFVEEVASVNGVEQEVLVRPLMVSVELNGQSVEMQVDTGAAVSLLPEHLYQRHLKSLTIHPTNIKLQSYSGQAVRALGYVMVPIKYGGKRTTLALYITDGRRTPLMGRSWLKILRLDWNSIFSISRVEKQTVDGILSRHGKVFEPGMGKIKGMTAKITLREDSRPIFHRARPVPFAIRERVATELDRLVESGVMCKVNHSEWATPIVVVPKADDKIRICGDYKVTVNTCVMKEHYPLPNAEDLFATLAGGKYFSKIDLSHAYQQLELEKESRSYLTINTQKGLYQYVRLPFGVSSAPSIFQGTMDKMLSNIEGVCCFLDDILITAATEEEHLVILDRVLSRLERYGVKVNKAKCEFVKKEVEYLGHKVDCNGLHPTKEKLQAIAAAPEPRNLMELRSYLGLLNYYGRFIKDLSTWLQPLHVLLRSGVAWNWTKSCRVAFEQTKKILMESDFLVHYDNKLPLKLACDASQYGLGAVLSHCIDGRERPIAFASRTLSAAERNYPQIEKEALSIIFGVKKFHKYLYGRHFILITDHRPLVTILGPKTSVPTLAAVRMQRWALMLQMYDYSVEFRKSSDHANADAMSRLPMAGANHDQEELAVHQVSHVDDLPVTSKLIAAATRKDVVLSRVLDFTMIGWPDHVDNSDLQPYFKIRNELSVDQDCILWGMRVVIPSSYRATLLEELHAEHTGMVHMKSMARSYFWWPKLDADIEDRARQCRACAVHMNMPPKAPLHQWSWATRIWQRIHVDFAEKDGQMFLLVVDSHSKWLEVIPMGSTTASKTIETLQVLFAAHGLPEEIVSDNGPQFIAMEFHRFCLQQGIKHIKSAPYHPATNGAVERCVQTVKQALRHHRFQGRDGTLKTLLSNFLFRYRCTPHSTTGRTPSELFLKRQIRNRFSLIKPNFNKTMERKQEEKQMDSVGRFPREFVAGELVYVRIFRQGEEKWAPGVIEQKRGPMNYLVLINNQVRLQHVNQLRRRMISSSQNVSDGDSIYSEDTQPPTSSLDSSTPLSSPPPMSSSPRRHSPAAPRRSQRSIRPPMRFQDFQLG